MVKGPVTASEAERLKPTYQVRIWQEDEWWLARVMSASDGADPSPLNALTQARSLAKIESMGRDLIATVLDADEDAFEVHFEYQLPGESGELVGKAKGARAWLDAAQDLWHKRSAAAARALAEQGYSLRDTAALLSLSHQRVDQILTSHSDRKPSSIVVFCEGSAEADWLRQALPDGFSDFFIVVGATPVPHQRADVDEVGSEFERRFRALLREAASRMSEEHDRADLEGSATAGERR
jgi:hypothetical protein